MLSDSRTCAKVWYCRVLGSNQIGTSAIGEPCEALVGFPAHFWPDRWSQQRGFEAIWWRRCARAMAANDCCRLSQCPNRAEIIEKNKKTTPNKQKLNKKHNQLKNSNPKQTQQQNSKKNNSRQTQETLKTKLKSNLSPIWLWFEFVLPKYSTKFRLRLESNQTQTRLKPNAIYIVLHFSLSYSWV